MAETSETQRGPGNPSSEVITENNNLRFDSSDDEAPEEVNFEDSKRSALQSVKDALEASRRDKKTLKEKRRRKQELFLEQKKRRLLPEDVLEEIDATPIRHDAIPCIAGNEVEKEKAMDSSDMKPIKEKARSLQANCSVTTVKHQITASTHQKVAMDFVQSRFYGQGTRRATNNELLSLNNKKGANKGAAFQFANTKLSTVERAKAEKGNKRWLHKNKLIST
ncbi:nucleolar protein 7 [Clupea harengus]|uniref:Nucleolar protein 7 n=1 Tax=Clupea harengus TaxID=7950 RepID=A0A6P8F726_CLUHA|nr:nucleolar protein 7 [Clupea harengus]